MEKPVLVCVTVQKECERLILAGRELARAQGLPLHVLHVLHPDAPPLGNPDQKEALNYLYALLRESGAELTLLRQADIPAAIAQYALQNNAACVVVGRGSTGGWRMADALEARLSGQSTVIRA